MLYFLKNVKFIKFVSIDRIFLLSFKLELIKVEETIFYLNSSNGKALLALGKEDN